MLCCGFCRKHSGMLHLVFFPLCFGRRSLACFQAQGSLAVPALGASLFQCRGVCQEQMVRAVLEAADGAASACSAETSLSFVLCCSSARDEPRAAGGRVLLSWGSSRVTQRVIRHPWKGLDSPESSSLGSRGGRGRQVSLSPSPNTSLSPSVTLCPPHRVSLLPSWGSDPETSPWSSPWRC